MFNASVLEIFITTTTGTEREVSLIEKSIDRWNRNNAVNEGIMLKVLRWRKDDYPSMTYERGQTAINKQLLAKADILIGVFWKRIGTPTTDEQGNEHISGSAEEISKHINAGKPAMLFFSKKRTSLESVDMEQYNKLIKFKNDMQSKGLIREYKERDDPFNDALPLLMRGEEVRKIMQNNAYKTNNPITNSYKLRFTWQFENGDQGKRTWYRDGVYLWREEAPAIPEDKRFACVEKCTINGINGIVTQSLSLLDKPGFQVFIPNEGETDMMLYWRVVHAPNNTWSPLGVSEISYF